MYQSFQKEDWSLFNIKEMAKGPHLSKQEWEQVLFLKWTGLKAKALLKTKQKNNNEFKKILASLSSKMALFPSKCQQISLASQLIYILAPKGDHFGAGETVQQFKALNALLEGRKEGRKEIYPF